MNINQNIFKSASATTKESNNSGENRYFRKKRSKEECVRDERFMKLYGNKYKIDNAETKKEEKPEININELYFPELGATTNKKEVETETETEIKMNYKEVCKKENVETNDTYKIPDGWTVIYFDEKKNIVCENGTMSKRALDYRRKEVNSTHFSNVVKHLVDNWQLYKEQYIDLYGYDEYEKTYLRGNEDYNNMDMDVDLDEYSDLDDESDYSYYETD